VQPYPDVGVRLLPQRIRVEGEVTLTVLSLAFPYDSRELPEAVPVQAQLSGGALHGKNDFGEIGYGGPCPSQRSSHRYQFTLYALDQHLDLKTGVSSKQVVNAMQWHILAWGQLIGIYQR